MVQYIHIQRVFLFLHQGENRLATMKKKRKEKKTLGKPCLLKTIQKTKHEVAFDWLFFFSQDSIVL